jgi:cold-inducible RNA-binding protein
MSAKLYVGNLNYRTTEASLRDAFAAAGLQVLSARVITDHATGQSRGFAFVELASADDVPRALETMNGTPVEGRPLNVTEARERAGGPPPPRGFGPRPGQGPGGPGPGPRFGPPSNPGGQGGQGGPGHGPGGHGPSGSGGYGPGPAAGGERDGNFGRPRFGQDGPQRPVRPRDDYPRPSFGRPMEPMQPHPGMFDPTPPGEGRDRDSRRERLQHRGAKSHERDDDDDDDY